MTAVNTATIDVGQFFDVLDPLLVEKRLLRLPGVASVGVNIASGTATIGFDETRTTVEAIRADLIACGFHCRGESAARSA
ncbi:MAG: heavy-metal-associated domain-containing protein, partial [Hyphomicrobium denitrificans]|nr:heavy-metal-associated domain-containing protein [Hyphomicrobium denitrificans]